MFTVCESFRVAIPGYMGMPYICNCNNTAFLHTDNEHEYECKSCGRIAVIEQHQTQSHHVAPRSLAE